MIDKKKFKGSNPKPDKGDDRSRAKLSKDPKYKSAKHWLSLNDDDDGDDNYDYNDKLAKEEEE